MSKTEAPLEGDVQNDEVIGAALLVSLGVLAVVGVVGGIVAWWLLSRPVTVAVTPIAVKMPNTFVTPVSNVPQIPFIDVTADSGIAFVHENGASGDKLLPESMGSGCAFFDYDNDGDQDLLFINSRRWEWDTRAPPEQPATAALYRNDGTGKFTNVTAGSGLDVPLYGMGVAVGDCDGDGRVDVFISAVGTDRLFRNTTDGFEDVTQQAGVAGDDDAWGTSCGWFDYDNDGDLDLFVCNYVQWSKEADLAQMFQLDGGGRAYGRPQNFSGAFCSLYANRGDGTFQDVSEAAGIRVTNPDTSVPAAKALGLAFADFDSDGYLDVVVANDTVGNFLFHNQRDGTFQESGYLAGVAYDTNGMARGAMGIDVAHFRNSPEQGIAIGNFANEMTALYVARVNQLQFRDDAVSNGLGPATRLELTFGLFFFDADLDGRLDLFAANGHLEEEINRVQKTQQYAQPAHFFWNCGLTAHTEFQAVPPNLSGSAIYEPMVGRGAAYADIDGDGDLDIAITACGGPARLLRNDQSLQSSWLRIKLVGKAANRDAIGTMVELHQGEVVQRRLVTATRSYLSQSELPVTFGLGDTGRYDKLIIRWPGGETIERTDLPVNELSTIEQ